MNNLSKGKNHLRLKELTLKFIFIKRLKKVFYVIKNGSNYIKKTLR